MYRRVRAPTSSQQGAGRSARKRGFGSCDKIYMELDAIKFQQTEENSRMLMMRRNTLLKMKMEGFGAEELIAAGYTVEELRSVGIAVVYILPKPAPLPAPLPPPPPSPGRSNGTDEKQQTTCTEKETCCCLVCLLVVGSVAACASCC